MSRPHTQAERTYLLLQPTNTDSRLWLEFASVQKAAEGTACGSLWIMHFSISGMRAVACDIRLQCIDECAHSRWLFHLVRELGLQILRCTQCRILCCRRLTPSICTCAAIISRFEHRVQELNPQMHKVSYALKDLYSWLDNMVSTYHS